MVTDLHSSVTPTPKFVLSVRATSANNNSLIIHNIEQRYVSSNEARRNHFRLISLQKQNSIVSKKKDCRHTIPLKHERPKSISSQGPLRQFHTTLFDNDQDNFDKDILMTDASKDASFIWPNSPFQILQPKKQNRFCTKQWCMKITTGVRFSSSFKESQPCKWYQRRFLSGF